MSCEPHNDIDGNSTYTYSTLQTTPGYNATVVDVQQGFDFPFKPFFAGNGIQIEEVTNPGAITVTYTGAPGQPYTYSTQTPGDATVVGTQIGTNFGFKPINGGTNIDVSEVAGAVVIDGPTYASNVVVGSDANITAAQVGNEFRFKPLNAGTNITIDEVTLPGAITISASGTFSLFQNNTLFVDQQYGSNITGTRERRDLPYQTITAAYNAAQSGDQIRIFPGFYSESLTVSLPVLNFYLEDGATWSSIANNPVITFLGGNSYAIDGHGSFNTSLVNGGIITSLGGPYIQFKANFVLNANLATAFRLGNASADIHVPLIIGNGPILTASNVVANSVSSITLNSDKIDNTNALFAISGTDMIDLKITTNYLKTFGSLAGQCNCAMASIVLKSNYAEFTPTGLGTAAIVINDTSVNNLSKSLVDVEFDIATILANNSPFVRITSTKTQPNLYPRFHGKFDNFTALNVANLPMFDTNGGDVYIDANIVSNSGNSTNGYFANVLGSLYLDVKNFSWIFSGNVNCITATNCFIKADSFIWTGLLTSSNGYIKAQSLTGLTECQLTGVWDIDTNEFIMSGTAATLINSTVGVISIKSNLLRLTTASNLAISSSATIQINSDYLEFIFSSSHALVNIVSTGNVIKAGYIKDIAIIISGELSLSADQMVNSTANNVYIVNNGGIFNGNIGKIDITNKNLMFQSIGINSVFNLRAITISHSLSLGVQPVLFDASLGGIFNISADNINYTPSVNGYLMLNSSNNVSSVLKVSKLVCSGLMLGGIRQAGTANTLVTIDDATVNCTLFICASASQKSTLNCQYATCTVNLPLIDVTNPPTVFEIGGTYKTAGANVITNSANCTIGLHGVKLLSTAACVNSTGILVLSITPSSARFAPVGTSVVPVGALFIDATLV